ncbi:MAG: hypothetical protein J2P21_31590 [Chloracidobacterium sp.]|nr:hypothetical protein [Chloracidobacterium sp.]
MLIPRQVAETKEESAPAAPVEVVNLHRDERDIRLLLNLGISNLALVSLLLASLAANLWQFYRRPDRIVVDRRADGDHVVAVNDRAVATLSAVDFGPDKPGDDDKRRLANEWSMARYAIDPLAREQAVEKLLRMMHPSAAAKFVAYLKKNGELERERGERWQSSWKSQLTVIDSGNPYRVNVVGVQDLNKVVSGAPQHETRQIMFSLRVMPDKESGRSQHNLYTGFLVVDVLDVREVASGDAGGESVLPQRQLQQ